MHSHTSSLTRVSPLVEQLMQDYSLKRCVAITWYNHFSVQVALRRLEERHQSALDYVEVDGLLLCLLCGDRIRTSADLVLPNLLRQLEGSRVLLIGGPKEDLGRRTLAINRLLGGSGEVVGSLDGYVDIANGRVVEESVRLTRANVVLVGLSPGQQEQIAGRAKSALVAGGIVATCGGFMDQISIPGGYYPKWAYPLCLNWLVRLAREPVRLWQRYSLYALTAVVRRREIREFLASHRGFGALERRLPLVEDAVYP